MRSVAAWTRELWRAVTLLGGFLFLGWLFEATAYGLSAGIAIYLGWHLYQLYQLDRWLGDKKTNTMPEAGGIWGEMFRQFYRLQQSNRDKKRRLAFVVKQFRKSTRAMPYATVAINTYREIQWMNTAAGRLLGMKPKQDTGLRIDHVVRHPRFIEYLADESFDDGIEIPSPVDSEVTIAVRVVPYGDNQLLLTARDITRRQRLDRLRQDFISNASHELRTPLTVIRGYLEQMTEADSRQDLTQWRKPVERMLRQTNHMQKIVEDMLLLARLESDDVHQAVTPVQVGLLLSSIVLDAQALDKEHERPIRLEVDDQLRLLGDERELHTAFSNLVFNAIRHTPPGTRITVTWSRHSDGARFAVSDTGPGIEARYLARLTERFYRVDDGRSRESGGTGLGLAIVKHTLELHDSRLQIESTPGKGSTFSCEFDQEWLL